MRNDNNFHLTTPVLAEVESKLKKEKINYAKAATILCKLEDKSEKFSRSKYNVCYNNIKDYIEKYKPKLIVAYGKDAASVLGIKGSISELAGRVFELPIGKVLVNFHPRDIYKADKFMELFKIVNDNIIDLVKERDPLKYEVIVPKTTEEALKEIDKLFNLPKGTKVAFDIETLIFDWDDKEMTLNGTDPYSDDNDILTIGMSYFDKESGTRIGIAFPTKVRKYLKRLKKRFSNKINPVKKALEYFNIPEEEFLFLWMSKKFKEFEKTYEDVVISFLNRKLSIKLDTANPTKEQLKEYGLTLKAFKEVKKDAILDSEVREAMWEFASTRVNSLPKNIKDKYNVKDSDWRAVYNNYKSYNKIIEYINNVEDEFNREFADFDEEVVYEKIKEWLQSDVEKICHNAKFELKMFKHKEGITVKNINYDTMLLRYQLKEDQQGYYGLKFLVSTYLPQFSNYEDSKGNFTDILTYNALDAIFTGYLAKEFVKEIRSTGQNSLETVHRNILIPATYAFSEVELSGVKIDLDLINKYEEHMLPLFEFYERKLNEISYKNGGPRVIEPSKSEQVAHVIYNVFKVPPKYTESGKLSVNDEAIDEALAFAKQKGDQDLVDFLVYYYSWAKLAKQWGAYIVGYKGGKSIGSSTRVKESLINEKTKRIHAHYNLAGTVTGRLSSSKPNFQQVPRAPIQLCNKCLAFVKDKKCMRCDGEGFPAFHIKSMFIAPEGRAFIAFDYSQLEVRVMALAAQDQGMIKAIKDGLDMHSFVGSQIFGYSYEEFYKKAKKEGDPYFSELRSRAKKATFGVAYGSTAYNMANELGITPEEAQEIIDNYFKSFPAVKEFITKVHRDAILKGMVKSLPGRIRHFPPVNIEDTKKVNRIKRMAQNFPIQSAGNDVGLAAVAKLSKSLKQYDAMVVGYVHDSIEIECPKEHLDKVIELTKETMEFGVRDVHPWLQDLPLEPDLELEEDGKRWAEEPGNLNKVKELLS